MKIFLSPEVERMIADRVSSGRYHSADEVVREGLELLQEREKHGRNSSSDVSNFAAILENISKAVPDSDWENVPADLSKNLDQYLYGNQKPPR